MADQALAPARELRAPRSHYSDHEKALALAVVAACDGNCARASELTGIPDRTLANWREGRGVNPAAAQLGDSYAREMLEKARRLADACMGGSAKAAAVVLKRLETPEALRFDDVLAALRTLTDAGEKAAKLAQLLDGQPTERTEARTLSLVALLSPTPPPTGAQPQQAEA